MVEARKEEESLLLVEAFIEKLKLRSTFPDDGEGSPRGTLCVFRRHGIALSQSFGFHLAAKG